MSKKVSPSALKGLAGCALSLAVFFSATLHAASINATIACVVSDSNYDGRGDEVNHCKGAPQLVSAAVNGRGGRGHNGTVRWQVEWNISKLKASDIQSAAIVLHTDKGSIDSLDTFLYHIAADRDGSLRPEDFQAPAEPIRDAIMPVVDGERTFTVQVTDLLRKDLNAGHRYFSIQGRVDERKSWGRGLQIVTTGDWKKRYPVLIINEPVAMTK